MVHRRNTSAGGGPAADEGASDDGAERDRANLPKLSRYDAGSADRDHPSPRHGLPCGTGGDRRRGRRLRRAADRIDPKDYQAAFAQAQASLALAIASLQYSRVSQGRNQTLARDGWVSQDTSDQANSTFHQGQASLANDEAALKEAALNLSRTEIRAPFAGRISASQVFTGSLISVAGATLNTLVQLDPIYVSFNPAEVNLPAITQEQKRSPIETAVSENGGKPIHSGTLTFIDNQVSQSTGTILLRATIANPDHALLPGQYVIATLHLGDLQGAVLVPQSAVGATQIGRTLMIVGEGNKVEQRLVKLGDNDGDRVVVTDGLKPGERVITGQLQKIRPGSVVQLEAAPR